MYIKLVVLVGGVDDGDKLKSTPKNTLFAVHEAIYPPYTGEWREKNMGISFGMN